MFFSVELHISELLKDALSDKKLFIILLCLEMSIQSSDSVTGLCYVHLIS